MRALPSHVEIHEDRKKPDRAWRQLDNSSKRERRPRCRRRLHLRRAISRILSPELASRRTIISLTRLAPNARPVQAADATNTRRLSRAANGRDWAGGPASCFVLHHMGFFLPRSLRAGRWALTPPFHPYRTPREAVTGGLIFCDTFRRPRLGPGAPACSTRHGALRCSDFPPGNPQGPPGDRLPSAAAIYRPSPAVTRGKTVGVPTRKG